MKIVWDKQKRLPKIEDHHLDFADLDESFFEDALVLPSYKGRRRGIGKHADDLIAVIFATLGTEAVSIISMRPASKRKGSSMPTAKNKKGYSPRDLREVRDNPEWTAEDFAKAKPFTEVFPELAAS